MANPEICRPESVYRDPAYGYVETVFGDKGGLKVWHAGRKISKGALGHPGGGFWRSHCQHPAAVGIPRLPSSLTGTCSTPVVTSTPQAEGPGRDHLPRCSTRTTRQTQAKSCARSSSTSSVPAHQGHHAPLQGVHGSTSQLCRAIAIQLNDTHRQCYPRVDAGCLDEEDELGYRLGHLLPGLPTPTTPPLPEALEKWSVSLFEKVLPRHLEITSMKSTPASWNELVGSPNGRATRHQGQALHHRRGDVRKARHGQPSVIGSSKVNGVAEIHLLVKDLFPEYAELWPEKMQRHQRR